MTTLKNHVTQGDLAHGKQLLLACERGSGRAFEALCEWRQAEHFGVSDEAWRKTIGKLCLDAGNRDRAVRLFDAMAKPFDENPYHNLTDRGRGRVPARGDREGAVVRTDDVVIGLLMTGLVVLIGWSVYASDRCANVCALRGTTCMSTTISGACRCVRGVETVRP